MKSLAISLRRTSLIFAAALLAPSSSLKAEQWTTANGEKVETNGAVETFHADAAAGHAAAKRDFPPKPMPWWLKRVNAPAAWPKAKAGVKVCVVGSGVDPIALAANLEGGENVTKPGDDYADTDGEGTEMAGIIAGAAPAARLYAVKVVNENIDRDSVSPNELAKGILACVKQGAQVISAISADSDKDRIVERAVSYATARGALIVAAPGTGFAPRDCGLAYPARYENVIVVRGSTPGDALRPEGCGLDNSADPASYGYVGRAMNFIAPGQGIITKNRGGGYIATEGSGASAAIVSGLAALYLSSHPGATPSQVKEALADAAAPLSGVPANQQGRGMIDAAKLVGP